MNLETQRISSEKISEEEELSFLQKSERDMQLIQVEQGTLSECGRFLLLKVGISSFCLSCLLSFGKSTPAEPEPHSPSPIRAVGKVQEFFICSCPTQRTALVLHTTEELPKQVQVTLPLKTVINHQNHQKKRI